MLERSSLSNQPPSLIKRRGVAAPRVLGRIEMLPVTAAGAVKSVRRGVPKNHRWGGWPASESFRPKYSAYCKCASSLCLCLWHTHAWYGTKYHHTQFWYTTLTLPILSPPHPGGQHVVDAPWSHHQPQPHHHRHHHPTTHKSRAPASYGLAVKLLVP